MKFSGRHGRQVFVPHFRGRWQNRGAALVIVLAFLLLATILVVTFFSTVSSEYGAAKVSSDVEAGRQLAETTVQIVMGQVRTAASRPGTAWASQPGMIRTYNDSGSVDQAFALYSTAQMVRSLSGAPFDPASDLPGSTWASDRARWVDLNFPAEGRDGQPVFPVIDPRAAGAVGGGSALVDGFTYDPLAMAGSVLPASSNDVAARLPMPVRWIYVLRDGMLTVPSGGSGTTAVFASPEPVPTTANPIVGRIAFWTDDETCKLNINTACGGVPWDTPIGNSGLEMLFARYQPAKNEFSRYPGHPASVSLAPVLWSFLGMASPSDTVFPSFTPNWNTTQSMTAGPTLSPAAEAFQRKLFPLIPRNTFGGSKMATVPTVDVLSGEAALSAVDSDRLFASADEILYGPDEASDERDDNPLGIGAADAGKLRFFLTAQSRAPEVNLFNLPKICLWPLPDATRKSEANANALANDTRSPIDRLIAFCSTLAYDNAAKKREYAFTRYDATSASNDFNATDAFGSSNNQVLYSYLEGLMSRPIPGFGGTLSARYGVGGSRQILGGIYDYIRSQINVLDTSHSASDPASAQNVDGAFVSQYAYAGSVSDSLALGGLTGSVGQVIPASLPNGVRGGGRFPVVSQVTLEFIAQAANQPPVRVHGGSAGNFPIVYAAELPDGTPSAERVISNPATFSINSSDLPIVLRGKAYVKTNVMHPWTSGASVDSQNVPQKFVAVAGSTVPLMAVDVSKLNPSSGSPDTDPEAIFPVFDIGGAVDFSGLAPLNKDYPSFDETIRLDPALDSGREFRVVGPPQVDYPYATAKYAGSSLGAYHTHPGLYRHSQPALAGTPSVRGSFGFSNPRYRGPNLAEYQTQIEPIFMLSFSIPGAGVPGYRNPFRVRVKGLQNLRVGGVAIFNSYDSQITTVNPGSQVWQFHLSPSNWPTASALIGNPFVVGSAADSGQTFSFDGGAIVIELLNTKDNSVVQTYNLAFPPAVFPTPLLPHALPSDNRARSEHSFWSAAGTKPAFPPVKAADIPPSSLLTFSASSALSTTPNHPAGVSGYAGGKTRLLGGSALGNLVLPQWPVNNDYRGKLSSDTVRSLEVAFGDSRMLTQMGTVSSSFFLPHRFYFDAKMRAAHSLRSFQYETQFDQLQGATLQYLTASSAVPSANLPTYGGAWNAGDPNPGDLWNVATGQDVQRLAYNYFVTGNIAAKGDKWPFTASATEFEAAKFAAYKNSDPSLSGIPDFPALWSRGGDFTSGLPGIMDGAMLGKVDEGNNRTNFAGNNRGMYPYFNELASTAIVPVGPNLFSPNRQVPSAVVLGSVPSGYGSAFDPANPSLSAVTPWRTLLFAPNPAGLNHDALAEVSAGGAVPQAGKAPDFTILDFFWMPVVEPYAISEPLSTAGKVNMNAQIAPFTYITRESALRGVLRSTLITAVPDKWINFKNSTGSGSGILSDLGGSSASINYANFRYPINAEETLKQFRQRFRSGDIFRSASEICSLWLYPDKRSASDAPGPVWDSTNAGIRSWWYDNAGTESKSVTGDNLREKPYATLYPLLTTKSNTYTVHFKVQTLQKVPGTAVAEWVDDRDRVTSEYQGEQTIERYVDPMDPKLIDFATETATTDPNAGDFYRFRILSAKRFSP